MKEKMIIIITVSLVVVVVVVVAVVAVRNDIEKVDVVDVIVTQNLESNGRYWTQFNLPPGGDLMKRANYSEYNEAHRFYSSLGRRKITIHGIFYGTFCCAETRPKKYEYLPTDKVNEGVTTLIFFADDSSVWIISIPITILTPGNGETITTATIYH